MVKLERTNLDYNGEAEICRYMDINKFLDFIINRRLSLSRMDLFEDPYEAISKKHLHRLFEVTDDQIVQNTQEQDDKTELSLSARQKGYFVSCWFGDKSESIAMWKLYAGNSGAMIRSKLSVIVELFEKSELKLGNIPITEKETLRFYLGGVDYLSFIDPKARETMKTKTKVLGFHKDIAYQHEKEYRFLLKLKPEYRKKFIRTLKPIQFELIEWTDRAFQIVLNPIMPEWQRDNLATLIAALNRKYHITKSTLNLKKSGYIT